jgi:hypothetical protein
MKTSKKFYFFTNISEKLLLCKTHMKVRIKPFKKKLELSAALIAAAGAHCENQNNRDDVHPVLRQERSVVLGFSSLFCQLVLFHLLDEGSSVRLGSSLHLLDQNLGLEPR